MLWRVEAYLNELVRDIMPNLHRQRLARMMSGGEVVTLFLLHDGKEICEVEDVPGRSFDCGANLQQC